MLLWLYQNLSCIFVILNLISNSSDNTVLMKAAAGIWKQGDVKATKLNKSRNTWSQIGYKQDFSHII